MERIKKIVLKESEEIESYLSFGVHYETLAKIYSLTIDEIREIDQERPR